MNTQTSTQGGPGEAPRQPPSKASALDWVVLKIAQRCNLNCTYCYVYNRGDDSWKYRPRFVSEPVLKALAQRIVEQCQKYSLKRFVIELHGGEPLLVGRPRMQRLVDLLREQCPGIDLRIVLQTNGLLLDPKWLELFDRNGLLFGLSLDGPPELADDYRVKHDGTGSGRQLLENVARLRAAGPLFDKLHGGTLCVINPRADGAKLLEWFASQGFRSVDFLLPDGNLANLPQDWTGAEPYRRFLLDAFRAWYRLGTKAPRVRTFEMMIRGFMGQRSSLDALGGDLQGLCVVESDGSIGVSDVARICGGPFSRDSLSVFEHPLDMHASHYRLEEIQRPSNKCLRCPYFDNCGGGYLPHRFDGQRFDNPSLYCDALYGLAEAIYQQLREDVPTTLWKEQLHEVA